MIKGVRDRIHGSQRTGNTFRNEFLYHPRLCGRNPSGMLSCRFVETRFEQCFIDVDSMIASARPSPRLFVGQLVRHRRYAYRGVIVHADPFCTAPDSWYYSNKTQPDREQPWYHVLVDGGDRVTYAAQSSLKPDRIGQPIDNPLAELFFEAFEQGNYVRNERTWDGCW